MCFFSLDRDVRRTIVALSRARLGLYVFARVALFDNCYELAPAFDRLRRRETRLHLLPDERWPCERLNITPDDADVDVVAEATVDDSARVRVIDGMQEMMQFVYDMYERRIRENPEQVQVRQYFSNSSHGFFLSFFVCVLLDVCF